MNRLFISLMTALSLFWSTAVQASVVQCQERKTADGKTECTVKYVTARPMAILACVGGAGGFVTFSEGDADEILSITAPAISGAITGGSWLEVASKVLERTNEAVRKEKIPARVQSEILEYKEQPVTGEAEETASGAKRMLFRVTGTRIKPPPPKERITFFNPKGEQ